MAAAAKTVKYHVSDCLQDRHPYGGNTFETQRKRDAGLVFDGMQPVGTDTLLEHLTDVSIAAPQRAVALKHILAHSAAAEKKVVLLRKNVVPVLASLLLADPTPQIELLANQVLRSLCILPQGCCAVIDEGGLDAALRSLENRNQLSEREDARTAAASVLCQIASNWAGRSRVLGLPVPQDFELVDRRVSHYAATKEGAVQLPEHVMSVLVSMFEHDTKSPKVLQCAAQTLSLLTTLEAGLHKALIAGALRVVSQVFGSFAEDDVWLHADNQVRADTVLHIATMIWHVGLDEIGQKEAMDLPLVPQLGRILAALVTLPSERHSALKAAVAGAVCALVLHPPMKRQSIEPLKADVPGTSVLDHILTLLRSINVMLDAVVEAQRQRKPAPFSSPTAEELLAIAKNCVQCVRLVTELPDGRAYLHSALREDDTLLKRQLFFSTPWQDEFNVYVY